MTTEVSLLYVGIGLAIGVYVMYTQMRIRSLEKEIDNFPTVDELAKEIIKVKLPISDLPPDIINKIKSFEVPSSGAQSSTINSRESIKPDYMG